MGKILGVTYARGGSKEVPRKNIREICGKPLIAWTIKAALKSKLLDSYIVSTEDAEIARIAREYGAEVLDRPPELATDEASAWVVLQHVLTHIEAEVVVILQCTSPVRDDDLIDQCIDRFLKSEADSLATGFMCKLYEWKDRSEYRRQDMEGYFHDDGNVYVIKTELVKKNATCSDIVTWGDKMERMIISADQNFEIDEEFDFWINEDFLKRRIRSNRV